MKGRKQKPNNTKKPIQIPPQLLNNHLTSLQPKQNSGHTKVSTNCTIHTSVPPQYSSCKKSKNKKNTNSALKQAAAETKKGPLTSKSTGKSKLLDLPLNVENACDWIPEESYREYCVVNENFIPISSSNQQKFFEEFFSKTASTSYDFNYFNSLSKTKACQPSELRKRSTSSRKQNCQKAKHQTIVTQKQDKAVSNLHVEKVYANAEIQVAAQCCQIGMQYSQRKQLIDEKQLAEQPKGQASQSLDAENMSENGANVQQSLTDLLFKLEFTHLMDEKSFNALSQSQKLHFSQLLESVIVKLSNKQKDLKGKQKIKPIKFDQMKPIQFDQIKESQQQNVKQPSQRSIQQFPFELISAPATVNFLKLQELIIRRQHHQKNAIIESNNNPNAIDTSLLSILNFLAQFFCFVQLNYTQEFVYMIGKMFGLNFKEKYKRVTRNLPLELEKRFRVIDEALFLDFINQSDLTVINNYEVAHFKAIFDAFNEHLQVYRPFYAGNGQPFPWSFKLFASMSEYSIDQDSLQIIFRQAKDKIFEWAQHLCGILVEYDQPLPAKNPLQHSRLQRQNMFIKSCIEEENFEKDGIELFATQTLHHISEDLFDQIIQQLAKEAAFLFI